MARSLRRNGKWEFSALLLHQRPVSCRIAAGKLTALSGQLLALSIPKYLTVKAHASLWNP